MKYRDRAEIEYQILNAVNAGSTKTNIMYKAYMSYSQLLEYIKYMETNDLMKFEEDTKLYQITDKGRKLMSLYETVGNMMISKTSEDRPAKPKMKPQSRSRR